MKKILSLIFLVIIALAGCDKVEPPYTQQNTNTDTTINNNVKRVLIEEFTGHLCPNCPEASHIAENLQQLYPGKITIIAIHSGNFANLVSPNYMTDFRTEEGNILNTSFGVSTYPSGMVDRVQLLGSQLISPNEWGSIVNDRLSEQLTVNISITTQYNELNRNFNCTINTDILSPFDSPLMLVALFTEDSIIDYQKNNNPLYGSTPDIPDYVHNHVLRGSITNIWGDTICANCLANDSYEKTYNYTLSNEWDEDNVNIVVYCYDAETQEI
ncbi:MAG TPA: Omp28 family outer membrane lipoprotein, partial [Bacteroidales bacterium]|nr:Omp28 family outer membrane lipoprotein [Bacteroidales bacterium]